MLVEKKTFGQDPFCSKAAISVPGAPLSSGVTDSHFDVSKPGLEMAAPPWVAVELVTTFQPALPKLDNPRGMFGWVESATVAEAGAELVCAEATTAGIALNALATANVTPTARPSRTRPMRFINCHIPSKKWLLDNGLWLHRDC